MSSILTAARAEVIFPTEARKPPRENLVFVDNVRFWSMVGIVAVHTLFRWRLQDFTDTSELQMVLLQMAKFGTIGFYVISGFLLGDRLEHCSPCEYLLRRIKNVAGPWAVWALVAVALEVIRGARDGGGLPRDAMATVLLVLDKVRVVTLYSPFWFVPNFLLSLAILLLFRRYLDDLRLGAALLACTLFYSVNVYGQWLPPEHTAALFGFIFYQWLGVWAARNSKLVFAFVGQIDVGMLGGFILLTGTLGFAETRRLMHFAADPFNTLRLSNQLFSMAVVIALVRLRRPAWPRFLDVRAGTYGLYLLHPICLVVAGVLMERLQSRFVGGLFVSLLQNPMEALTLWLILFVGVYAASTAITNILLTKPSLRWMIGRSMPQPESSGRRRRTEIIRDGLLEPQSA